MKKSTKLLALILSALMILCLVACNTATGNEETTTAATSNAAGISATGLWANATYLEDTTLGDGTKTVIFTVEAEGQKITITLKTDAATLGEAMYENELVEDASFFSVLNGMEASWGKDMAYWGFYQGEDLMMHGIGDEPIIDGASYRFVYTK